MSRPSHCCVKVTWFWRIGLGNCLFKLNLKLFQIYSYVFCIVLNSFFQVPSQISNTPPVNPPPPPPRNSSMRETSSSNISVDLEEKFKHVFQSPDRFPLPPPYRSVIKVYNNKPNMQKPGVVWPYHLLSMSLLFKLNNCYKLIIIVY